MPKLPFGDFFFFFWLLFLKGYWLFKAKELKMKVSLAHEGKRLILFPLHLLFAVLVLRGTMLGQPLYAQHILLTPLVPPILQVGLIKHY